MAARTSPAPPSKLIKMQGNVRLRSSDVEQIEEIMATTGMARAAVIRVAVAEGLRSKLFS
jgi:hypothetical protein